MDHPLGPFIYTVFAMHCMRVSLAQGGEGLGTRRGKEEAKKMLEEAGFGEVEVKRLPDGSQNGYYIAKKA